MLSRPLRLSWLPCVVALACALGAPALSAPVPACQGVPDVAPSLASLASGGAPPVSEDERIALHRYPAFREQSTGTSFWDFVEPEFFVVLGRTRASIEGMSAQDWFEAFSRWRAFERNVRTDLLGYDYADLFHTIDWLYVMARDARFVSDNEAIQLGLVGEFEIDPTLTPSRLVSERPDEGALWLAVAALYADARLDLAATRGPRAMRMRESYWKDFSDQSSSSQSAQRAHLKSYLCSQPEVRYLTRRAERMAQSGDPEEQARAIPARQAIEDYVNGSLADFDQFFDFVSDGSERSRLLQLVPGGDQRGFVAGLLDERGAALAFLQFRQVLYDTLASYGERGERREIWNRLPAHIRYAWPSACLDEARYPSRNSHVFAAPSVMATGCSASTLDRPALFARLQESQ